MKLEPEPRRFGPSANISANVKTTITPSTTHWAQFSMVESATTQSAIPNFGKRSTEEVIEAVNALGLTLRDE